MSRFHARSYRCPRQFRRPAPRFSRARRAGVRISVTPSAASSAMSAPGAPTRFGRRPPASTVSRSPSLGSGPRRSRLRSSGPRPACEPRSSSPTIRSSRGTRRRREREPRHERLGVSVTEHVVAVDRAGCYVPGGTAPLASSVLMTALPARVAGVPEVVLCSPPGAGGHIDDAILAAAAIAQVDEVYAIGGAQAIAALAFGAGSLRAVDVIVGPGQRVRRGSQAPSVRDGRDRRSGRRIRGRDRRRRHVSIPRGSRSISSRRPNTAPVARLRSSCGTKPSPSESTSRWKPWSWRRPGVTKRFRLWKPEAA